MSLEIANSVQARCTMMREFSYRLLWRPEKHYDAGTQVELRSHCLRAFHSWRLKRVEIEGADIAFRWKSNPSVSDVFANPERVLVRATLPEGARQGSPVEVRLTVVPPLWAGVNQVLSVWTIEAPAPGSADQPAKTGKKENDSSCELSVVAAPVERMSVYCHPAPGPDGMVRACIVPEDRFGNPGRFQSPVDVTIEWNGQTVKQPIREMTVLFLAAPRKPVTRAVVAVPMAALGLSETIANGVPKGETLVVTGNPVWREGVDGWRPAFGEFHWHTDYSLDGQRPLGEALQAARDALNMDFAAPGDHNTSGEKWSATVAALEAFNQPGAFATFFGWEACSNRGHENFYFVQPDHPLVCGGEAGHCVGLLKELPQVLRDRRDFMAIPHHTNAVSETRREKDDSPYWHPYAWSAPQEFRRLVEIFQTRGNQERNDCDDAWRGWHQNNGASAQDALAAGHRLGFVGGTDNHCGWPGRAFAECEGAGKHPPKSVILTGLWTRAVDRQSVFDALYARQSWAVWDTRAIVFFTVNGMQAGGELSVASGSELTARLRLSAEAPLQSIEIVSNGATVWSGSSAELDIDLEVSLGKAHGPAYFYLRALERSGGLIYASPVFVTVEKGGTHDQSR